jgi:phage FluMu protein Com
MEESKKDIRCPKCNRMLAKINQEGNIEVKSRTCIFVVVMYKEYRIKCKCGYEAKGT